MAEEKSYMKQKAVAIFLLVLEVIFIIIIGVFAQYHETADARGSIKVGSTGLLPMVQYYTQFSDVSVMVFVGFGFLMTFLKRYGFSSFGYNMLLSALVIQWATIINGVGIMIIKKHNYFNLHLFTMFSGQFAAASILISLGAVLGKTSLFQLVIMALLEVIFLAINETLFLYNLLAVDVGGSMVVHAFGAYFGLAVARVLYNDDIKASKKENSVYHSDIFSLIGTVFLWVFWPSFNAAFAEGDFKHRAVINTFYAMTAATVVTFAMSMLLDKKAKLNIVHIQNATLAGGVAVGTCADMMIMPYGAMLLGAVGGLLSTIGYKYITPLLAEKLKIHDTCGVNNLHGMPAILAGIAGAIASALASEELYGGSLYKAFQARAPNNATDLEALNTKYCSAVKLGLSRSAIDQGGYQMLGLVMTMGIAIVGGIITGFIMKIPIFQQPKGESLFEDDDNWILPADGVPSAVSYYLPPLDPHYIRPFEHIEHRPHTHYVPTLDRDLQRQYVKSLQHTDVPESTM